MLSGLSEDSRHHTVPGTAITRFQRLQHLGLLCFLSAVRGDIQVVEDRLN